MIVRTIMFISWELRRWRERRKLPPEVLVQLERAERRLFLAVSCPICGERFQNLGNGRKFRWHILGHDEGD